MSSICMNVLVAEQQKCVHCRISRMSMISILFPFSSGKNKTFVNALC